ncbi:DUF1330 domain-containing protein [Planosporangium sp. 12N6]|uniref:DUF1330 domain-containing protein n=1 Tax=Planosporangium spinosum TaxID=3402278 RepID=UPI003CF7E434
MPAYAIAHLRNPRPHPEIVEYLERIQATLNPYRGRFLVHGAGVEVLEGDWPGTIVIIEFPGMAEARSWYESPGYQEILPLRTRNIDGEAILVEGVESGYDPAVRAATMREQLGA